MKWHPQGEAGLLAQQIRSGPVTVETLGPRNPPVIDTFTNAEAWEAVNMPAIVYLLKINVSLVCVSVCVLCF